MISAIRVTDESVGDAPVLPGLVESSAKRFDVAEVAADKAYLSHANLAAIEAVGAQPLIPFKMNSQGEGPAAWRKLWHLFNYRRDDFLAHYHQRSNVEATFSALKRKFGGAVRSKLPVAQRNEVLAKALCFNLATLVHEMRTADEGAPFDSIDASEGRRDAGSGLPRRSASWGQRGRRAIRALPRAGDLSTLRTRRGYCYRLFDGTISGRTIWCSVASGSMNTTGHRTASLMGRRAGAGRTSITKLASSG